LSGPPDGYAIVDHAVGRFAELIRGGVGGNVAGEADDDLRRAGAVGLQLAGAIAKGIVRPALTTPLKPKCVA
jgi:hypothetical protein